MAIKEIETLIPHRAPFLYVDKLISASREEIAGIMTFSGDDQFLSGSFPEFSFVPGAILIEAIAQCGGAGIKKLGLADGLFGLANIESAHFFAGVEYEKIFTMIIKNIKVTDKYIKQTAKGYVDQNLCVELTWTCVKFQ